MARPLRIQYPGAWYHVTCRGNERISIFRDDTDRRKFINLLEESAEDFGVEVHGFCLMSNHFHLLLKTPLANLNRFMQRFNTAYIVYFNWKHERVGHLYQGRYKAILVDADNYLLGLSRYIHLNPVRLKRWEEASLKEKFIFLKSYTWSSFPAYLGIREPSFLHLDMILGMVGGGKRKKEKRYRDFVLKGLREGVESPLLDKKASSVLGSEEFIEWVYDAFVRGKKEDKEFSKLGELVPIVTIEKIAIEVAKEFGVKQEDLLKRYSRTGEARPALIELCCRYAIKDKSLKEIARQLGLSSGGILRSRGRFQEKIKSDPKLRESFERVEKKLRQ